MSVSIVIPVYGKVDLTKALSSIINQTFQGEMEIIIVWDKPTNVEFYEKYLENSGRDNIGYKIITRNTKTNPGNARNIGIRKAKYENIFFLDSDDYFHTEKINEQLKIMESREIGLSYTDFIIVDKFGNIIRKVKVPDEHKIKNFWIPNRICTSSVCVKKKYINKVGGFDSSLKVCEDLDLWIRLSKVTNFKKLSGYYTYYTASKRSIKERLLFDKYRIRVFKKNRMYLHLIKSYEIYARGLVKCILTNTCPSIKKKDRHN